MRRSLLWSSALSLAACGGSASDPDAAVADVSSVDAVALADAPPNACVTLGGSACFELPTGVLLARVAPGMDGVPPSLGCGPPVAALAPADVAWTGVVQDLVSGDVVGGARVQLFADTSFTTPIVDLTSAPDGSFSTVVPAGTPDHPFLHGAAPDYMEGYAFGFRTDLSMPALEQNVSLLRTTTVETVLRLARVTRVARTPIVMEDLVDCEGHYLEHAVLTLSSTPGAATPVDGAVTLYVPDGTTPTLARRDVQHESADNGTGFVVNTPLEVTDVYAQVWGFPDEAALAAGQDGLALVAENHIRLFPDSIEGVSAWPTRR